MPKGKRTPVRRPRGTAIPDRYTSRRSGGERWGLRDDEDDPLRDLRPRDEEIQDQPSDEYMWPDMNDEQEEDD